MSSLESREFGDKVPNSIESERMVQSRYLLLLGTFLRSLGCTSRGLLVSFLIILLLGNLLQLFVKLLR